MPNSPSPSLKNAEPLDHPKEEIQIWPGTNHWCIRGIFIIDIHLSKHQETEETEQWIARCQLRTRTTKTSNTWKPGMIWHWTQLEPTRDQIILILMTYTWNSYFQEWRIPITFLFCFKSQRQNTRKKNSLHGTAGTQCLRHGKWTLNWQRSTEFQHR